MIAKMIVIAIATMLMLRDRESTKSMTSEILLRFLSIRLRP